MKKVLFIILLAALAMPLSAQNKKAKDVKTSKSAPTLQTSKNEDGTLKKVYDETIDPMAQIDEAIEQARESGRFVICQVGGNWCPWCLRFAKFITENKEIAEVIEENFVYIHVNTSKENRNEEMLKRLGNPGRFGYPVFVILDEEGRVMHIQNSSYLEEGKSYDYKKVLQFFQNWTHKAIEELK